VVLSENDYLRSFIRSLAWILKLTCKQEAFLCSYEIVKERLMQILMIRMKSNCTFSKTSVCKVLQRTAKNVGHHMISIKSLFCAFCDLTLSAASSSLPRNVICGRDEGAL